jgi:hypothetical protein
VYGKQLPNKPMELTRMRRRGVRPVRGFAAARRAGNEAAQLIVRSLCGIVSFKIFGLNSTRNTSAELDQCATGTVNFPVA